MKSYDRRDFLIKASLTGVTALAIPSLGFGNIRTKDVTNIVDPQGVKLQASDIKVKDYTLPEPFWMRYQWIYLIRTGVKRSGIMIFET